MLKSFACVAEHQQQNGVLDLLQPRQVLPRLVYQPLLARPTTEGAGLPSLLPVEDAFRRADACRPPEAERLRSVAEYPQWDKPLRPLGL